jgi:hypothetical protein
MMSVIVDRPRERIRVFTCIGRIALICPPHNKSKTICRSTSFTTFKIIIAAPVTAFSVTFASFVNTEDAISDIKIQKKKKSFLK